MKTNIIKMSLVTVVLLSSGVYAGKIIGVDANTPYEDTQITPPTQYGFGGWNFDNINVKITDLDFVEIAKEFNTTNGTYDAMVAGDTFESEILDSENKVLGKLHGKDWPLGEPAGIKVINNDTATEFTGKPANCIMTTSYLHEYEVHNGHEDLELVAESGSVEPVVVSGLLNTQAPSGPMPTICSSPFQTHKRFKVNMQPELLNGYNVETGYGKSFDLTFNLDTEDTSPAARRYQVFQKINNYTDMRLQGYKIELLDGEGLVDSDADLELSLKMTTKKVPDTSGLIATFSNGLWGPKDDHKTLVEEEALSILEKKPPVHFTENGFFDKLRAGFTQELTNENTAVGGLPTLGSNYADLFGIWLPSKWAPYGYFFDDDDNVKTDPILVAYWGTTPDATEGTLPKWHKGNDYNETDEVEPFALVTAGELEAWGANPLYSVEKIEDTLNLGLNYVVEVGLNSTIGEKFTIRITPRVAPLVDQTPPSYIDGNGDYILPPEVIIIAPAPLEPPVANAGVDMTVVVNTPITITGTGTDVDGTVVSYEWKYNDLVISNTASFEYTPTVSAVATLTLTVTDDDGLTDSDDMVLTITNEDGSVDDNPILSGSGGGGCSYNPNNKSIDLTMMLLVAMGLFYPFRRRFLK